ncbi:sensor histidine kinase [Moraxella nasicaprae]|uniref:histidine kinase n=1 Tax=Moraxella nasicaprae TaxID=2904122 RepID=A0ABY6F512_9GAMM|nr:ATP-binding protein [Moraxella nasicaprae]UXZ04985.1 ATP-binding protein [Moraxella nasicaprae]
MRSISIQKQLLKNTTTTSIILAVLGFLAVGGTVIYHHSQVFDELLAGNANALLGKSDVYPDIEYSLQHLNDEMDIEYQVINQNGQILNQTLYAPSTPYLQEFNDQSYYNIWQNGQWLRVYTAYNHNLNRYVQIAQPWRQRFDFALPVIANYMAFVAAVLLVLALSNFWVIRKTLRPLKALQDEVASRHLQDLSSIQPTIIISETRPLLDAINQLFERLIIAKESQERFTADASHELRTPLAAVDMKLQLMGRKFADQPDLVGMLTDARLDVKRSTQLVESLLTLARLDNEQVSQKQTILVQELPKLLQGVIDEFADKFSENHSRFMTDWERCLGDYRALCVHTDLLLVAIRNLLDNALKYGGHQTRICLQILTDGQGVRVGVLDDGVGVSAKMQHKLTERFFRVLGTNRQGSGLGLSIVAKIAQYHHGQVQIGQGLDGTGLGVFISLPFTLHR